MKRTITPASVLLVVLSAISCGKEFTPEVNPSEEAILTECTFTASIEDSKLTLSGLKSSWNNGDEIAVCQYGRWKHGDYTRDNTRNKFTASGSGSKVFFSGTIADYHVRDNSENTEIKDDPDAVANQISFTHPYSALSEYSSGNSIGTLTVPSTQTGKISDFGKYAHYNDSFSESETNTSFDGEKLTFKTSVTLKSITPVIKFNVPASLNATKIEIYGSDATGAAKGIAGTYKMRLTGSTSSFVGATESKITISDNVISGEKYVVLAPSYMTGTRALKNGADILAFKIYSGDTVIGAFEGKIKGDKPTNGYIKDLGTLPSSFKQIILDVVPDSSFPTSSEAAVRDDKNFYSDGYKFTVLANDDGGTNYTKLYYSSSYITWTKGDSTTDAKKLPLSTYVYIKIPAIPGYTLSKATFFSNNNSKTAYIYDTYKRNNSLGSVILPSKADETKLYVIDVTDPGDLSEYYFVVGFTSTIRVKNLKLYYTKKPE